MANILYSLSGEGSGHSSRAKEVLTHLQKQGHNLTITSYDKGVKNLSPFFTVEEIFGLHFVYKKNQVQYLPTVLKNITGVPEGIKNIEKFSRLIKEKEIDLIITDFEPFACYVGNQKKIPVISLDNQHRLTKAKIEFPKKYQLEAQAAKLVTQLMIPKAEAYLSITFFPTQPTDKKAFFFPPILRSEVLKTQPRDGDTILVYFTSPYKEIIPILKSIRKKFICYGFNRSGRDGNLVFKNPSSENFLKDLASCEAVIANSGFTLVTEALHLHKPYLGLPVQGQFEQILNAYYIEKLEYGRYYDELDREKIEAFLYNLDVFKKNVKKYKRQDNSLILKKLDQLIKNMLS